VLKVREGETTWCKENAPSTDMKTQLKIISHCKNNQAHEDDSTVYFKSRDMGKTTDGRQAFGTIPSITSM
jgi:hypothetical protein